MKVGAQAPSGLLQDAAIAAPTTTPSAATSAHTAPASPGSMNREQTANSAAMAAMAAAAVAVEAIMAAPEWACKWPPPLRTDGGFPRAGSGSGGDGSPGPGGLATSTEAAGDGKATLGVLQLGGIMAPGYRPAP